MSDANRPQGAGFCPHGGEVRVAATGEYVVTLRIGEKQLAKKARILAANGYAGRIEIHSYQRLKNGLTMIAESGNAHIVEVDKKGQIVKQLALTVERPNAHRDTRMVRKLDNGNYLVCHEGDGKIREYDVAGKVVWTYELDLNGRPA